MNSMRSSIGFSLVTLLCGFLDPLVEDLSLGPLVEDLSLGLLMEDLSLPVLEREASPWQLSHSLTSDLPLVAAL